MCLIVIYDLYFLNFMYFVVFRFFDCFELCKTQNMISLTWE